MRTSRRRFLSLAGSATVVALSPTIPLFLRRAAAGSHASRGETVLVVVQLTGGNDGLNTVIPYGDDEYQRNRFALKYGKSDVLKIDDYVGFHPSLKGFAELLEANKLAVVQGVGYPNPNRSHFESMDIWHTARHALPAEPIGWLGRGLDTIDKNERNLPALHLGRSPQPLALAARDATATSLSSLADFRLNTGNDATLQRAIYDSVSEDRESEDELLSFLQSSTSSALESAERVELLTKDYQTSVNYPATGLAQQLKSVAQLISAGLNTRIYYLTLDGFDTHSNQRAAHAALLAELSGAVSSFIEDVAHQGHGERVALMTFSEFGRRVKENASGGTDHGAAAPMFIAGANIRSGLVGKHPSLTDLDDGDVKFHTDFRSVYAGVLKNWLGWNPRTIVGEEFDPINVFES